MRKTIDLFQCQKKAKSKKRKKKTVSLTSPENTPLEFQIP
jgi:hypothetical protein